MLFPRGSNSPSAKKDEDGDAGGVNSTVAAAPVADLAIASTRSVKAVTKVVAPSPSPEVVHLHPPRPPATNEAQTPPKYVHLGVGRSDALTPSMHSPVGLAVAENATNGNSATSAATQGNGFEEAFVGTCQKGRVSEGERGLEENEEESVESLLSSLMRALNTEQGRSDFSRLTATSSAT